MAALVESSPAAVVRKPAAVAPSLWKRLLIPDVAFILALKTLFFCLLTFDGLRMLYRDGDPGLHIVAGEAFLSGRGLPGTDWLSFSSPGAEWVGWEWLVQVGMALLNRLGGLSLVAVAFSLLIAVITWVWFRLNLALGGDFLLTCAGSLLLSAIFNMHWLARPHVVAWLLLLFAIWWMEKLPPDRVWRTFLLAAASGSVWASAHATFLFLIAICGLYAAGWFLRPLLWRDLERVAEWPRARAAAFATAGAVVGSFLTPYGWKTHLTVWQVLRKTEGLSRLSEYQPFDLGGEGGYRVLALFAIAALGALLALRQRNLARCAVILMLGAVAAKVARGVPILALVGLPLSNTSITGALGAFSTARNRASRALAGFLGYGRGLQRVELGCRGWVWIALIPAVVVMAALTPPVRAYAGFPAEQFPVEASSAVAALPRDARILAPDTYGGYLIYRFGGDRKIFFDGRTDIYSPAVIRDYLAIVDLAPGWREAFARWRFTHALLPPDHPLAKALGQLGWTDVHRDKTAVLLAAPPQGPAISPPTAR